MMTSSGTLIKILEDKATRLRIDSIRATTAAGSGHPTSWLLRLRLCLRCSFCYAV